MLIMLIGIISTGIYELLLQFLLIVLKPLLA